MTSPDERREVAERLREAWPEAAGMEEVWEVLDPILGTHDGPDVYRAWEQTFNRLADLIDPTCTVVRKQVRTNGPQMYKTLWCCSECGFPLAESKYKGHRPFVGENYCPRCGARVVEA